MQWMLRITEYADRLLQDLDDVDWSDSIKDMQRNWIGRSKVSTAPAWHTLILQAHKQRPQGCCCAYFDAWLASLFTWEEEAY